MMGLANWYNVKCGMIAHEQRPKTRQVQYLSVKCGMIAHEQRPKTRQVQYLKFERMENIA